MTRAGSQRHSKKKNYGTCFISPFWRLECWGGRQVIVKFVFPGIVPYIRRDIVSDTSLSTLVLFRKSLQWHYSEATLRFSCCWEELPLRYGVRTLQRDCPKLTQHIFPWTALLPLIPRMLWGPSCPINTLWLFPGDICSYKGSGMFCRYINKEGEGCTSPLTGRSSHSHNQPAFPL